jgi:lipoprotein signal peptidase
MQRRSGILPTLELSEGRQSAIEFESRLGQRSLVFAFLATIIVLDQTAKWWVWRHVPTFINPGGDVLVGSTVGKWYADPAQGALLDLLGFGLLSSAISVLWHRRLSRAVLVTGCMIIGGWSSNLLDRLGMHSVTAPGSDRGAIDFIPISPHYYNIADLFIIVGTPLFLLAVGGRYLRSRMGGRSAQTASSAFRSTASLIAVGDGTG